MVHESSWMLLCNGCMASWLSSKKDNLSIKTRGIMRIYGNIIKSYYVYNIIYIYVYVYVYVCIYIYHGVPDPWPLKPVRERVRERGRNGNDTHMLKVWVTSYLWVITNVICTTIPQSSPFLLLVYIYRPFPVDWVVNMALAPKR